MQSFTAVNFPFFLIDHFPFLESHSILYKSFVALIFALLSLHISTSLWHWSFVVLFDHGVMSKQFLFASVYDCWLHIMDASTFNWG